MITAACSCLLLLALTIGPPVFLALRDVWRDVNRDLP